MASIDVSPLTRPIGIRDYTRGFLSLPLRNLLLLSLLLICAIGFAWCAAVLYSLHEANEALTSAVVSAAAILCAILGLLAASKRLRVQNLATVNGFEYHARGTIPQDYQGIYFNAGWDEQVYETVDHFMGDASLGTFHMLRTANLTPMGTTRQYVSYVCLPFTVPHPTFIALHRANHGVLQNLQTPMHIPERPVDIPSLAELPYTVYSSSNYEQGQFGTLGQWLLGTLADQPFSFDVELQDQRLFLYSLIPFRLTNPGDIQSLATLVDELKHPPVM